jgi:hypothetical protein
MGGSTSTTTQKADPWKPAQPFILEGLGAAGDLFKSGGFNVTPYGGPMIAGYDPMRAQGDRMTGQAAQAAFGAADAGTAALTRAMDPTARSDAWGQVRQNTIDSIMPGINASFAGSGMTGGDLHQQNLAAGLSRGLADVENQAWQQGENRALSAAGMLPTMQGMRFGAADALTKAGMGRQQYDQSVIAADAMRDQQAKTAPIQAIQDYLSLVSGLGANFSTTTASSSQSPGLMGLLGFGLQAAPLMFSDRRLKTDIKKVGKTDDGLSIFTYRYKAGGPTQMGVMAQEVEKVRPEAVREVAGFKAVDYGAL